MNQSGISHRLRNWRQWELNPVVVKELRQAVRSWAVTGMLLLFLVILFATSLGFLVSHSFRESTSPRMGSDIFQAFVGILTGASMMFIPLYVGVRLAFERQESNLDLLYTSTLSPGRIIRGKFFCGAYLAILFFSACMPFMAFTNLLRGVDLPTIFFILVILFLAICAAVQVAIFLACLPISKALKILLALIFAGQAMSMVVPLVLISWEFMRSGIGMMMGTRGFWLQFATMVAVGLSGWGLLYFLSVALISPHSANRALPLRLYITAVWLVGGILSAVWLVKEKTGSAMIPWAMVTFVLMIGATAVVVSSQDELSLRVRRAIPRNLIKRFLAFLFYNGAAGGLVWVFAITGITYAAVVLVLKLAPDWLPGSRPLSTEEWTKFSVVTAAVLAYAFAYALTALFLHRFLFAHRTPKLAGGLALLLPGIWAILPGLVLFFMNKLSWQSLEKLQLGNVFNLFIVQDIQQQKLHLVCALGWLLLAVLLNLKWFARQTRNFQPLHRPEPAPAPTPVLAGA